MKKNGQNAQKTDDLLRKLQASLLAEKRQGKQERADADDLAFQEKIAGMLRNATAGASEGASGKPSKEAPKEVSKEVSKETQETPKETRTDPAPKPKKQTASPKQTAPEPVNPEPKTEPKTEPKQEPKNEPAPAEKQEQHIPPALRVLTEDARTAPEPVKPEPKPESKPEPKTEPKSEPKPAAAKPPAVSPPPKPKEQEEAVQEKKEPNSAGAKPTAAKPTEPKPSAAKPTEPKPEPKPIVIGTAGTPGDSAKDPIVIKPRTAAERPEVRSDARSDEKKPEPAAQPITIVPPRPAQPHAAEEPKAETKKIPSGVSLPRRSGPERPWEKPSHLPPVRELPKTEPGQGGSVLRTEKPSAPAAPETAGSAPTAPGTTVSGTAASGAQKNGFRIPARRPKRINRTPIATLPQDENLDEALDDTVESAVPELITMDAPDPAEAAQDAVAKKSTIFSRRREKKMQEALGNGDAIDLIRKKTGMSEDDIAMIFELGYDNELGRVVGYETLKKLKAEYRQKTREAEHHRFRTAFGYRGEDGTDAGSRQSALAAYAHDRKNLILRVVLTALCTLLLAFSDLPGFAGGALDPYRAEFPWLFPAVSLCLLFAAAALSWRQIDAGLRSLFRFTPTPYSAVALLTPIALLYGGVVLLCSGVAVMQPIGFGTAAALLLTAVCDTLRLVGEMRCFRIAAADGTKTVLESTEPRKKKLRHGERVVRIINDEIDENLYRVRESSRVAGFFHRCNDFSSAALPFTVLLGVMLGISILCGVAGAVRADSPAGGLSAFAITLMYTVPTPGILLYFYPLFRANRMLERQNATLIGEGSVSEYSQTKTVIFNDSDLYPAQKCTQISVRDGEDFRHDMKLAGILFRKMSGTMDAAGMNAKPGDDLPVVFLRMTDVGAEALVDNRYHMLAGNAAFLGKSGVRIPRESTDRSAKRAGNVSLMYVAIDGVLKLSYEIEYSTSPEFETMAELLAECDTVTAIQTYDPNLCEAFLRTSRGENAPYVRVVKPGRYEQDGVQPAVDSGAVALGKKTDIARPLYAATAIVRMRRVGYRALCVLSVAGAVLGAIVGFRSAELSEAAVLLLPPVFRLAADLVTAAAVSIGLRRK